MRKWNKLLCFDWSRKTKKTMFMAVVALIGLGSGNLSAVLNEVHAETVREYPVSDDWLKPAKIHVSGDDDTLIRRGASLPASYDAREYGLVTAVKDQGDNETCWAFSSVAAMETNLVKNGKASADIDLSENQVAYFFYNSQMDQLGYTQGDYNRSLRGNYLSTGGSLHGTGLSLATWVGVTTEDRSPYLTRPSMDLCYLADYSVKNVYIYDYDVKTLNKSVARIKQAVLDHGAVATGLNFSTQYYSEANSSYYYPYSDNSGNHAVAIIGWDDSYSRQNFVRKPSGNGAWIVKNSYGSDFGDEGFNYISYEDKSLTEMMTFEMVTREEQYDNNYQHDGTANPTYGINTGDWYANVFTAKGADGYNEELEAVGVYSLSENAQYEIQVYTGLSNIGKPTSGTKVFSSSVKGKLADAGYQTIVLPKKVSLTAGERFSILVRLTESSGKLGNIGLDISHRNDWIEFIANTDKNQSFAKIKGKWYDIGKELKYLANVRIKAYTNRTNEKSKFQLSSASLGISKDASSKLSLKMNVKNVYRNVVWKSSNTKIATVNDKGTVKGHEYGTATITASFVGSSKTKKLTCKVTVGPSKLKSFTAKGGKKLTVKWKKNSDTDGYEVYYSTSKSGTYKKLKALKKNKTSYSKKLETGTYYVKVRPYKSQNKKKLYGSFTAVKSVTIK